ncbi:hypothetical protein M976_02856 [Buttiauxella ferragutiae ATCC 51602]|uniref:Uncharacterized protein n=1 Tax=Buttiauxella ferragutiae ATCC 51602 TaxID=1354252 RepID=A0ABX2W729_9ENTR|nr:hypothetical protein M976_02856 [Buttiauxella ferragutiae ATCC 51602]
MAVANVKLAIAAFIISIDMDMLGEAMAERDLVKARYGIK